MANDAIGFIGAGNMAGSMIAGLHAQQINNLWALDLDQAKLDSLQQNYHVSISYDLGQISDACSTLVLAVKPQHLHTVMRDLAPSLSPDHLLISIAAGITSEQINSWCQQQHAIVRCMPNTPAAIGQSASGAFANAAVTAQQQQQAQRILSSIGVCEWVAHEPLLDVITAISGSGPAYFFLLMEMLQNCAEEHGLPAHIAATLVQQTAKGAANLVDDHQFRAARERVTSPGGTTACMLDYLEQAGIRQIFQQGIRATVARAEALSKESQ